MNSNGPTAETVLATGETLYISPKGNSMLPLIKAGRDTVYINGTTFENVKRGDIVLYRNEHRLLVLHRLIKKTPTAFYTVGDNQLISAGPYYRETLLGKMIGMERKGKYLDSRQTSMRLYGKLWMLRRRLLLIVRGIVKRKNPFVI